MDREDGLLQEKPAVLLLRHIHEVWPPNQDKRANATFVPTEQLIMKLINKYPLTWGTDSSYGRALTAQRLGSMLAKGYKIHTKREGHGTPRGYFLAAFDRPWRRMGITPRLVTGSTGESGESGEPEPDSLDEPVEPVTGEGVGEPVQSCGWCNRELIFEMEQRLQTCSRCQPVHGNYLSGDGEVAS